MASTVQSALPDVGELPFVPFTSLVLVLFAFACFMDVVLVSVLVRAKLRGRPLPLLVEVLNWLWMLLQIALLVDLAVSYFRYYRPRARDLARPKMGGSSFYQPRCWACSSSLLGVSLDARGYLLWLALLLPLNALFFHGEVAQPVFHYGQPWMDHQESRLSGHNISALLDGWPAGGGLAVDPETGAVSREDGAAFDPPLVVTSRNCYATGSGEFQVLGRLQGEDFPKQAYCETLIGTLMVDGKVAETFQKPWMSDEDRWDEAFDFSLRLFSSLAGLIADQMTPATGHSKVGFWFLRDMTDVYDMYMLSFADVDQMHEGRPLLGEANFSILSYSRSFHVQVGICIWLGVAVLLLRAAAISGLQPFVSLLRRLGCAAPDEELRKPIDAALSLFLVELPFLALRFTASWNYGVPVSVMAVKNSLGAFEDLCLLSALCRRRHPAPGEEPPPSALEPHATTDEEAGCGGAPSPPPKKTVATVRGILLP